jgi:protein-tyrosine phosphatase
VFNWLKKSAGSSQIHLTTDIHSHLLPNLDDGVKSWEEVESIITTFLRLGYRKLITTPHVMQDHYRNTSETIRESLVEAREYLRDHEIPITLDAAAEYYLDEHLMKSIESNELLLTFGDQCLLFETNFISEPLNFNEFIFSATTRGYKPVLAHPERYLYLQNNMDRIEDLINRGVLFQLNIGSLTGFYSKNVQTLAGKLIEKGFVHILGSDCHNLQQAELIDYARRSRYFEKALTLGLMNNSL